MTGRDMAGISTLALQMYCPPWDVHSGLNVRLRVNTLPVIITAPTVILVSLTVVPLVHNHSISGSTTRLSTTVALQVRVYTSPAVLGPSGMMTTSGGGSARVEKSER